MSTHKTSWPVLVTAFALVIFCRLRDVYSREDGPIRQYNFTDKDVRLVGGNSELEGRVEIRIHGVWGTICYDWFHFQNADVLCKMLHKNLSALEYYTDGRYGMGSGPVFYRRLSCSGSEDSVHNCSSETGETCSHSADVGLMCTGCSRSEQNHYGMIEHVNITSIGDVYVGTCSNGTATFQFLYRCNLNGTWEEDRARCGPLDVKGVRLVDGVSLYDGAVEVLVGGVWGPVCGHGRVNSGYYNSYDAGVFCQMLGLRVTSIWSTLKYNTMSGFIFKLSCPSGAAHVHSCNYTTSYTCYYQYGVACEGFPLNISSIQLVGGSSERDGRVELHVDNKPGTICQHGFDFEDSEVLCTMLGFGGSAFYVDYWYNTSRLIPMVLDLGCTGTEGHINNCSYRVPSFSNACEDGAVSLVCADCGQANISHGQIQMYNDTTKTLTVRCHSGNPEYVQYVCESNGAWSEDADCKPVVIQDMRLVSGSTSYLYRGTVELKVNDTWGTICDSLFGHNEAQVLCRMMNLSYSWYGRNGYFGEGYGKVHMSALQCTGSETDVSECSFHSAHNCTHSDDVGIVCSVSSLNITNARLVDGTSRFDGRVELLANGVWGSVCDSGFDTSYGEMLCRMMNLTYIEHHCCSRHGSGEGPMLLRVYKCREMANHINECNYDSSPWCYYYQTISLVCSECPVLNVTGGSLTYSENGTIATLTCDLGFYSNFTTFHCLNGNWSYPSAICLSNPPLNITDVRLADGPSPNVGRVEIVIDGIYGTVCDSYFDYDTADVICKSLNSSLHAAVYFTGARFNEGSGPVHIDQLHCESGDTSFEQCKYEKNGQCDHSRDVSVVCNECGQPDIAYWGVGYFIYNGTSLYANCEYYKSYIGYLQMVCTDSGWKTIGDCLEYTRPLHIQDIRLVGGLNKTDGRVEIKVFDTWGTICRDSFGLDEANVICSMIGFYPARRFYTAVSEGTGPIFVDNMACGSNKSHINECQYDTNDNCYHNRDVAVTCTDCGDPTPSYGHANDTKTNVGTVVNVSCEHGRYLNGDSVITCLQSGKWSSSPSCILIDCGNPTPQNGNSNGTSYYLNNVLEVTCNTGYNLSGESVIRCQSNITWTDMPTCNIVDCHDLVISNMSVDIGEATSYGEVAVVRCNRGFEPRGSWTVKCEASGDWNRTQVPTCEQIDCGDPTPSRGQANTSATVYSTVVKISCNEGYEMSGNPVIVCQENGTWTGSPICDPSDCGKPQISNAELVTKNGTSLGAIATIMCNTGFAIQGPHAIACMAYGWNASVSCDLIDCHKFDLENGFVYGNETTYGASVEVECDIGHTLSGSTRLSCQYNGLWSDRPACVIKDCGNVTGPSNGSIMNKPVVTTFNSVLRFKCDDGYLLRGNDSIQCDSTGHWTSSPPTCFKKSDIGGTCTEKNQCLAQNAMCKDSKCACISGVLDRRTNKCDIMPLMPFGNEAGDVLVDEPDCSEPIVFKPAIPVFHKMRDTMHVCKSGLISFDKKYLNPKPTVTTDENWSFYEPTIRIIDPIVAAYFAHTYLDKSSSIHYRTYDVLNDYPFTTKASTDIRFLENLIKQIENISSFDARFVLIATWNGVKPSNLLFDRAQSATFQLVIISSGELTFVLHIYGHELMNWRMSSFSYKSPIPLWIGHSDASGPQFSHLFSFKTPALRMDLGTKSGGIGGLLLKNISSNNVSLSNHAVDCIMWYNRNVKHKDDFHIYSQRLPSCPCDVSLAQWDPWFWAIRRLIGRHTENDILCVDMQLGETFKPYGKSCCYYRTTLKFIDERPLAGGLYIRHPSVSARDHQIEDIIAKDKCCNKSDYCDLYYQLHPPGTCYRTSPYNLGSFWGDPHIRTLDGMNYTFNGLGEYVLLSIETSNVTFSLQARTERAVKKDGNLSDATIFTAFAAKDHLNCSIHIELNTAKDDFTIYGNGIDLTPELRKSGGNFFAFNTSTLTIHADDGILRVSFLALEITLNIGVGTEMLSLDTIIPKTFQNKSRGLLGYFDGNPYNDFLYPNGSVLNSDAKDAEIFLFGQSWAVDDDRSAFIYEDGKSHADYHNASYVPRFLDTVDNETLAAAIKACNGSENMECVFDYAFTLNIEVAENTNNKRKNVDLTKKEIVMVMPRLNTCGVVNITVGENVSCTLDLDRGLDIQIIGNIKTKASYDKETTTLYFRQTDVQPQDVWFIAVNTDGKQSLQQTVPITLCTGCNGHGYCTEKIRSDPREKEYFKYSECVCNRGYDGVDCEHVYDGCANSPCSLGRICTRLSAAEQKDQNRTYMCSSCPVGYEEVPEMDDCRDINECNTSKPCDQICLNNDGSYSCECNEGFRIDEENTRTCVDINECNEATHNCTHLCENIKGGFRCKCQSGYVLNESEWTCQRDDVDPCANSDIDCSNTSGCILDANNQTTCFCDAGYSFNRTTLECQDINECQQNICPQECTNTIGSFQCSCVSGYHLVGRVSCEPCVVPYWGNDCNETCNCAGRGAERCDPVRGCVCLSSWTGSTCDDDVDECEENPGICSDGRKTCNNYIGSFTCDCIPGYREDSNGFCRDINECSDPLLNECTQTCLNTEGSYTCGCESGYTQLNLTHCEDIDECKLEVAECAQMCENHPGYYNCYCYFGYRLNDDRRTCSKVKDVCKEFSNLTCAGYCIVKGEKASCQCNSGFELNDDHQTCNDINECLNSTLNKCSGGATCTNTQGSFLCECPVGMKLQNDKRTCAVCDSYHYGKDCSQTCSCIRGVCNNTEGCVCTPGWTGVSCDVDIDECIENKLTCNEPHTQCMNTQGNATCACMVGYRRNVTSGVCDDVNECNDVDFNNCDQICTNTQGSYYCSCRDGFLLLLGKCSDINECKGVHGCEQQCDNTIGSYRCSCRTGFVLDLIDRKSCIPEEICSTEQQSNCSANASCSVSDGDVVCVCPNGYSGPDCTDIDECKANQHRCNQICNNTFGSYRCVCEPGFSLKDDNTTCQACNEWFYGKNCATKCVCNANNTNTCNRTTGSCTCKNGWKGLDCFEDVDECNATALTCPDHATCVNKPGRFSCECNKGYLKNSFGQCQECQQGRFGTGCAETCSCNTAHTSDCKNDNGMCICDPGWMGDTCNSDVKECDSNDTCPAYSTCIEAPGSYECRCNTGFRQSLSGNKCLACSDNTYGDKCSLACQCQTGHTKTPNQSCDHVNGACLCTAYWKGLLCEEDFDECQTGVCADANAFCHNTLGGYKCYCKKGFVFDETRGLCKDFSKVSEDQEILQLEITLDVSLGNDINFNVESTFAAFAEKVVSSLKQYWSRFIKDYTIVINSLRKGSLHVDYTIYYSDSANPSKAVTNALVEMSNGTQLEFDGVTVSAVSERLANESVLCDLYEHVSGVCGFGMVCVVQEREPGCIQNVASTDTVKLIVGVTVAGGLLLILGVIIALYALHKRKARNAMKLKNKMAYDNRSFQHGEQKIWKSPIYDDGRHSYGEPEASRYRTWRSMALGFSGYSTKEHAKSTSSFQLPRVVRAEKRTSC